jgi:hypothetical protein
MQHHAIPNQSPFYAKLGELSANVEKYANSLETNKGRQDARKEVNKEITAAAVVATKTINVEEVQVTRREGISPRYNSLICALERSTSYEIVELVDHLPEDKEKRRVYLRDLQLPIKAVVSELV